MKLKTGDRVRWKDLGKWREGVVQGLRADGLAVLVDTEGERDHLSLKSRELQRGRWEWLYNPRRGYHDKRLKWRPLNGA